MRHTRETAAEAMRMHLAANPGWHGLGAIRRAVFNGRNDDTEGLRTRLRAVVTTLCDAGEVEIRGGMDGVGQFQVRAREASR